MAEVLRIFDEVVDGEGGRRFAVQACGRRREEGPWEGWLEFAADDAGPHPHELRSGALTRGGCTRSRSACR